MVTAMGRDQIAPRSRALLVAAQQLRRRPQQPLALLMAAMHPSRVPPACHGPLIMMSGMLIATWNDKPMLWYLIGICGGKVNQRYITLEPGRWGGGTLLMRVCEFGLRREAEDGEEMASLLINCFQADCKAADHHGNTAPICNARRPYCGRRGDLAGKAKLGMLITHEHRGMPSLESRSDKDHTNEAGETAMELMIKNLNFF